MLSLLRKLVRGEEAATAVEYAIMLALILMICIASVAFLGEKTKESWQNSNANIEAAVGS
jgi:pilus assembly protein Flp/PilA